MTVEDRPEPEPGPDDSLLTIIGTGICRSDRHGYTGETGRRHPGQVMATKPWAASSTTGPARTVPARW